MSTCDFSDEYPDRVRILAQQWRDYGDKVVFHGPVSTVRAFEDNSLVRKAVDEPGNGRVLVVDGGGSLRRSMLGDQLAELAFQNGWSGFLIYGAVRDRTALARVDVGIKALGNVPQKTEKRGLGERDVEVEIDGVAVRPGDWLYADEDGVIVADSPLF